MVAGGVLYLHTTLSVDWDGTGCCGPVLCTWCSVSSEPKQFVWPSLVFLIPMTRVAWETLVFRHAGRWPLENCFVLKVMFPHLKDFSVPEMRGRGCAILPVASQFSPLGAHMLKPAYT